MTVLLNERLLSNSVFWHSFHLHRFWLCAYGTDDSLYITVEVMSFEKLLKIVCRHRMVLVVRSSKSHYTSLFQSYFINALWSFNVIAFQKQINFFHSCEPGSSQYETYDLSRWTSRSVSSFQCSIHCPSYETFHSPIWTHWKFTTGFTVFIYTYYHYCHCPSNQLHPYWYGGWGFEINLP